MIKNLSNEKWKTIPDHPHYMISNKYRVKRKEFDLQTLDNQGNPCVKHYSERLMKPQHFSGRGNRYLAVKIDGKNVVLYRVVNKLFNMGEEFIKQYEQLFKAINI